MDTSGWNKQVNWSKLKTELNKLTDVAKLKADLHKIAGDLRKFDYHTVLTPQALERVKTVERNIRISSKPFIKRSAKSIAR